MFFHTYMIFWAFLRNKKETRARVGNFFLKNDVFGVASGQNFYDNFVYDNFDFYRIDVRLIIFYSKGRSIFYLKPRSERKITFLIKFK